MGGGGDYIETFMQKLEGGRAGRGTKAVKRVIEKWTPMPSSACECPSGSGLAGDCGVPEGSRIFDPRKIKSSDDFSVFHECRCAGEDDEEPAASPQINGLQMEEVAESDVARCAQPLPDGFNFGAYVRINKQVVDSYLFGILPRYRHVGVSGTVAQVVCPEVASVASKGRVCLRTSLGGGKSVGCWLPKNLVVVEDFGGKELATHLRSMQRWHSVVGE